MPIVCNCMYLQRLSHACDMCRWCACTIITKVRNCKKLSVSKVYWYNGDGNVLPYFLYTLISVCLFSQHLCRSFTNIQWIFWTGILFVLPFLVQMIRSSLIRYRPTAHPVLFAHLKINDNVHTYSVLVRHFHVFFCYTSQANQLLKRVQLLRVLHMPKLSRFWIQL